MNSNNISDNSSRHVSVMLEEVLSGLEAAKGGDFLDCTLGGAGHTEGILEANPKNTVLGCDRDQRALDRASKRLERFGQRVSFTKASFSELTSRCAGRKFDGMMADLGVSTDQLFEERGFSFRDASALDMRMDESSELSAEEVINSYSESDLLRVLKVGGVGPSARAVVRAIMKARPIKSTSKLAEIVGTAAFNRNSKKKVHPATVVFQSIRMEVNQEVPEINSLLEQMPGLLKPAGRCAVICFHSGEDKLIARTFRRWAGSEEAPAWWAGDRQPSSARLGRLLQNEAQTPAEKEIEINSASRSARLRVFIFGKE
jgi:16S rRNA (cytosine1402-N4)-methyltransferase